MRYTLHMDYTSSPSLALQLWMCVPMRAGNLLDPMGPSWDRFNDRRHTGTQGLHTWLAQLPQAGWCAGSVAAHLLHQPSMANCPASVTQKARGSRTARVGSPGDVAQLGVDNGGRRRRSSSSMVCVRGGRHLRHTVMWHNRLSGQGFRADQQDPPGPTHHSCSARQLSDSASGGRTHICFQLERSEQCDEGSSFSPASASHSETTSTAKEAVAHVLLF